MYYSFDRHPLKSALPRQNYDNNEILIDGLVRLLVFSEWQRWKSNIDVALGRYVPSQLINSAVLSSSLLKIPPQWAANFTQDIEFLKKKKTCNDAVKLFDDSSKEQFLLCLKFQVRSNFKFLALRFKLMMFVRIISKLKRLIFSKVS